MLKANWLESLQDDEIDGLDLHLLVKEDLGVVFDHIFFFFFLPLCVSPMLSHT
jgi:hypothetical protein